MKISLSKIQYQKGIYLILFLGVVICFWRLGSTGLVDETPPLFAAASRAMSETGNWLTPRVNGLNRFDKPPLIYWLMSLFYSLPGQNFWDPLGTWAARLPSAISTLLMMIVLGDTLMKWPEQNDHFPRRTAVIGSLVFALSPIVVLWSRIAVSDALLCCTLGSSLILSWRTYVNPVAGKWWCSWFVLGLAVLTKGPVALVLTAMTYLLFGFAQKDYINIFKRLKPLKGLLITFVVCLPWYIAELFVEGKPFLNSFFGYHNFQRLTSVVNSHSQPWWFFLMMLVIASLPFTPFLIVALYEFICSLFKITNKSNTKIIDQSLMNFSGSWLLSIFLLFTFAATKLPSYWLPATPAAAIMIALISSGNGRRRNYQFVLYIVLALLMLGVAITLSLPDLWIFSVDDPEMPNFAADLMQSGLHLRASFFLFVVSFIGFIFTFNSKIRNLIFVQIPLILLQLFVMIPLWDLADSLRQEPLRQVSKLLLSSRYANEPIAMVGVRKPSVHFYTNQLVTYELSNPIALVNLSERLRSEVRSKWNKESSTLASKSPTILLVIDSNTSKLPHWNGLQEDKLASFGIYNIWRLDIKLLEERENLLKRKGVKSNWKEYKNERL